MVLSAVMVPATRAATRSRIVGSSAKVMPPGQLVDAVGQWR
jgi:hypothetical protein